MRVAEREGRDGRERGDAGTILWSEKVQPTAESLNSMLDMCAVDRLDENASPRADKYEYPRLSGKSRSERI